MGKKNNLNEIEYQNEFNLNANKYENIKNGSEKWEKILI